LSIILNDEELFSLAFWAGESGHHGIAKGKGPIFGFQGTNTRFAHQIDMLTQVLEEVFSFCFFLARHAGLPPQKKLPLTKRVFPKSEIKNFVIPAKAGIQ
jgi:hypothetical protein